MRLQRDRCVETVVHTEDCRYLRTVRIADRRRVVEGEALRGRARGRGLGRLRHRVPPRSVWGGTPPLVPEEGGGAVAVGLLG